LSSPHVPLFRSVRPARSLKSSARTVGAAVPACYGVHVLKGKPRNAASRPAKPADRGEAPVCCHQKCRPSRPEGVHLVLCSPRGYMRVGIRAGESPGTVQGAKPAETFRGRDACRRRQTSPLPQNGMEAGECEASGRYASSQHKEKHEHAVRTMLSRRTKQPAARVSAQRHTQPRRLVRSALR